MTSETITIQVATEAAQAFNAATAMERRKLELLITRQLLALASVSVAEPAAQVEMPTDPIFQLGTDPIAIDVTDASANHDRYLYL